MVGGRGARVMWVGDEWGGRVSGEVKRALELCFKADPPMFDR